ncbi:TPA: hypothetical protein DCE37_18385 [Candidatus Latescibacteria bacterium]|nr:hypothetical protein [Candidatus Latescibacterota bacterium]
MPKLVLIDDDRNHIAAVKRAGAKAGIAIRSIRDPSQGSRCGIDRLTLLIRRLIIFHHSTREEYA